MPDVSIANLPAFLGPKPADADIVPFTNVGDTTESPLGTTKRMTVAQLFSSPPISGSITIPGNLTVNGLTTLNGALVGSSGTFSGALVGSSGTFSGAGQFQSLTVSGALNADGGLNVTGGVTATGSGTFSPDVRIKGTAAQTRGVLLQTGNLPRWYFYESGETESGGNVGSNLVLAAYDDAGTIIDAPLQIPRVGGGRITLGRGTDIIAPTFSQVRNTQDASANRAVLVLSHNANNLVVFYADTADNLLFVQRSGSISATISNTTNEWTFTNRANADRWNATSLNGYYINGVQILWVTGLYTKLQAPDGSQGINIGNATDPNLYIDGDTTLFRNRAGTATWAALGNPNTFNTPVNVNSIVTATGYDIGGRPVVRGSSSYTFLMSPDGANGVWVGAAGVDPVNYYDGNAHLFRSRSPTATMFQIQPNYVVVNGTSTSQIQLLASGTAASAQIIFYEASTPKWQIGLNAYTGSGYFDVFHSTNGIALRIAPTKGVDFFGPVSVSGMFTVNSTNLSIFNGEVRIAAGSGAVNLRVMGNGTTDARFRMTTAPGVISITVMDATEVGYTNLDFTAAGYQFNNGPVIIPVAAGLWLTGGPFTPASSAAAGTKGQFGWDASFLYICVATNSWRRATLFTF